MDVSAQTKVPHCHLQPEMQPWLNVMSTMSNKVHKIWAALDASCTDEVSSIATPTSAHSPLRELTVHSTDDITKLVQQSANKSCSLDNIPTSLFKQDQVL